MNIFKFEIKGLVKFNVRENISSVNKYIFLKCLTENKMYCLTRIF